MEKKYKVDIHQIRCPMCGITLAQWDKIKLDLQKLWKDDPTTLQMFLAHLQCLFRRCQKCDLPGWDTYRTAPWLEIVEFPDVTMQQIRQLLTIAA